METQATQTKRGRGRPKGQVKRSRAHFYIDDRVLKAIKGQENKSLFVELAVRQRLVAIGKGF